MDLLYAMENRYQAVILKEIAVEIVEAEAVGQAHGIPP